MEVTMWRFLQRNVSASNSILALAGVLAMSTACSDATPPESPRTGSIRVTSLTTGQDLDADGYLVTVDNGLEVSLLPNGSAEFRDVTAGTHDVRLLGVDANCTAGGGETQRVGVTAAQVSTVAFSITCITKVPSPIPDIGTLEVSSSTSGYELDRDGYRIELSTATGPFNSVFVPLNGVVRVNLPAGIDYSLSLDGVAANCHADASGPNGRVKLERGETSTLTYAFVCDPPFPDRLPAGDQLAFVRDGDIHLVNSDGTGIVRLTSGGTDCSPSWSPDGARIAFVRGCNSHLRRDIYVMNADGSNIVRRTNGGLNLDPQWSPDGAKIVFSLGASLYVMSGSDTGPPPGLLVSSSEWSAQPSWSPDGSKVAYVSNEEFQDGGADVFILRLADQQTTLLTNGGGTQSQSLYFEPAWSPNSKMLAMTKCFFDYFICPTSLLTVVNVDGSDYREIAEMRGMGSPTWSANGQVIAFTVSDYIGWIRPDGALARGTIVADGSEAAWRPVPAQHSRR
jgi:Tol biopolymer transport system component